MAATWHDAVVRHCGPQPPSPPMPPPVATTMATLPLVVPIAALVAIMVLYYLLYAKRRAWRARRALRVAEKAALPAPLEALAKPCRCSRMCCRLPSTPVLPSERPLQSVLPSVLSTPIGTCSSIPPPLEKFSTSSVDEYLDDEHSASPEVAQYFGKSRDTSSAPVDVTDITDATPHLSASHASSPTSPRVVGKHSRVAVPV